jgi:hypothetical protein
MDSREGVQSGSSAIVARIDQDVALIGRRDVLEDQPSRLSVIADHAAEARGDHARSVRADGTIEGQRPVEAICRFSFDDA